jgi:hypothetical protein
VNSRKKKILRPLFASYNNYYPKLLIILAKKSGMRKLTVALLALLLFSCNNNHTSSNGTVYLRTVFWANSFGGSLDISWIYLGSDGTFIRNPKHGLDPVNIAAEKNDNAENVGTYKTEGDKLKITWDNGKTDEWTTEREKGEMVAMDGGLVSVPDKFGANEKIEGQFAATAFSPGFSNVQTMVFKKDGSFALTNSNAVSTEVTSAYGESTQKGKYELNGNTIHLKFDNGNENLACITHWKQDDGKLFLVINHNSFPQEN